MIPFILPVGVLRVRPVRSNTAAVCSSPHSKKNLLNRATALLLPWERDGSGSAQRDTYPRYNDLILWGKRIRGVSGYVRLGFFNLDATFGETHRGISGDSLTARIGTFQRKTLAIRPSPHAPGATPAQQLGVLDFQDAVYGPITYDIASLMRSSSPGKKTSCLKSPSATGKRPARPA